MRRHKEVRTWVISSPNDAVGVKIDDELEERHH